MVKDARSMLKISYAGCPGLSFGAINCAPQLKVEKHQKSLFWGSRSFKVINVDTIKKLVTSASYDKQYVSAYLLLFSRSTSQYR